MAYRRPAIEVVQEFQNAAAALALPSLPACVVGPAFQIVDDANAGVYSEDDLSTTSYSYPDLAAGSVVDLTATPTDAAEAGVHKAVGVKLKDAYLIKLPAAPQVSRITGESAAPNLFTDATLGAFSSIDPDADGAPTYYVDVISGSADTGRKLVIKKNSDNELVVAAEWTAYNTNVVYRVLEYRATETIPTTVFSSKGITPDEDSVDIQPGLTSATGSLPVVEATILLSWRALRPDMAGKLNAFTTLKSLEDEFGVGTIIPANVGPYAVNLALQNTTTEVSFTGLGADFFSNEQASWQSALEFLETKDVYAIAVLTNSTAVHQLVKSHVDGMSLSTVGKERYAFIGRKIATEEVLVPSDGIGTVTTAGSNNGTQVGTQNKVFKDPTNGKFITDTVGVGDFVQITSYASVGGIQRQIAPNEADYFKLTGSEIRITNAAFVAGDVGKHILVRDATSGTNNLNYTIDTIVAADGVTVTPNPGAAEAMASNTRAWVVATDRNIPVVAGNSVVQLTKVWTFTNGAFTSADIGKMFFISGTPSAGANDGAWTIGNVTSATTIVTVEAPAADATFVNTEILDVYTIVREPARDILSDSVNGTNRNWTFRNAIFTEDDVGRTIDIGGAQQAGNLGVHTIEAIVSANTIRTTVATIPVTEAFDGQSGSLSKIDVLSVAPNATEDAYITGTKHQIASVTSSSQLTLASDPTAGFGGTLNAIVYKITKDMTLNEQASFLAGYASSLGTRRISSCWPDTVAVSVNNLETKIPGYMAGGAYSGLCAGLPSQAGFTNLTLTGFVGRSNSDDIFSDTQLDTIAGGGNMVLTQPVAGGALLVRHQLTTDVSTIYFQELSVTKNVDLIARFFRNLFRPYIGTHNITDTLLDILKTRADGGTAFLLNQRAPKVGAPIRAAQLSRIEESANQPDTVEIDLDITVPLPLNNVKLTLLV